MNKSGLSDEDFSHLPINERIIQGKDIGEYFIKEQLSSHGIVITKVPDDMDKYQKIDGKWNDEYVQIKLRKSGMQYRNDIAYEVCRNHNRNIRLKEQLKNTNKQGRDYKGKVVHYFVMNKEETEIYHVLAKDIKTFVEDTINELNQDFSAKGCLKKLFKGKNQTELRPTFDKDPKSFTPSKVMAFIPVEKVIQNKYQIK